MPIYSAATSDHTGGGVGLSSAMGPKDEVGWMRSSDDRNGHKKQRRKPMVPSIQGSPRAMFC